MSSPRISEAKALAKKHDKTHVVIFHFNTNTGKIGYASYGVTKKECAEARQIGDMVFEKSLTEIAMIISQGFKELKKAE